MVLQVVLHHCELLRARQRFGAGLQEATWQKKWPPQLRREKNPIANDLETMKPYAWAGAKSGGLWLAYWAPGRRVARLQPEPWIASMPPVGPFELHAPMLYDDVVCL